MFVRDPCGIICIIVTYVAVFYADYVVVRWIILHTMQDSLWGPFHVVIFNTVMLLLMMSHLKAVCSDPGVVPLPQARMDFSDIHNVESSLDESDERDDWTVCTRCETYRPPRAHHCRICKRCIRRMDHHCPWINNCVGERNQKYFIQFLVYVGILAVYAITLVIVSWVYDCPQCSNDVTVKQSRISVNENGIRTMHYINGTYLLLIDGGSVVKSCCPVDLLHCVILVLESALFGMFVVAILVDQFQAILGDETAIERIQGGHHQHHKTTPRTFTLLSQVCGKSHPALWIFPCHNPPRYSNRREMHLINHDV